MPNFIWSNMFKLINLSGDELRLDEKGVSEMVTKACIRAGVYVEGLAVRRDAVTLICTDNVDGKIHQAPAKREPAFPGWRQKSSVFQKP